MGKSRVLGQNDLNRNGPTVVEDGPPFPGPGLVEANGFHLVFFSTS